MTFVFRAASAICGTYGTVLTLSALLGMALPCTGSVDYCRESQKLAFNSLAISIFPLGAAGALYVASELKRGY